MLAFICDALALNWGGTGSRLSELLICMIYIIYIVYKLYIENIVLAALIASTICRLCCH